VLGELKKHFDSDVLFLNFLSGDVGTIGSIETVVLNMPKRPNSKAVTQSKYGFNAYFTGAGVPYKQSGYETIFLYGGNSGWRNVFAFAGKLGFDSVEGAGSMDPKYERNQWGVYDEYLFENIYNKLRANPGKPKFIFAMTTSNHPPYSLPAGYKKLPLEVSGALKDRITGDRKLAQLRFETYQYANQKVGELISRIKASPLGQNTIIAVTGDHNFWSVFDYSSERYLDLDGVPFYLYIPRALRPADIDTGAFGSHLDIMPTLYNLSLSNREYASLGVDMLNPKAGHLAFNADGLVMSGAGALRYLVENNTISYYDWDRSNGMTLKSAPPDAKHDEMLKHFKSALAVADYIIRHPFK
jgi:phosphoglycerol transferase MdoB-like AlkP superfamily enzyme